MSPPPSPFGGALKADFAFAPSYTNLNHGSFGGVPRPVTAKQHEYQARAASRPDAFLRWHYAPLTHAARAALAALLNSPLDCTVLVSNASEAVNTVLRCLPWRPRDAILHFDTAYPAVRRAVQYVSDTRGVLAHEMPLASAYPLSDDDVVERFCAAVAAVREGGGYTPRLAVFDVVSAMPAVRVPWRELCAACRRLGVLSLVDGAQGVGMLGLDLAAADPDFFTSNCHKWLFVPHGCAVLYAAPRNVRLLTSPLATPARYIPEAHGPRPADSFALSFEFVGTRDYSAWWCVPDALAYRRDVLGGEEAIMEYVRGLNKAGSRLVARALGTLVLDNEAGSLTDCAMAMVGLPVWLGRKGPGAGEDDAVIPEADERAALDWMARALDRDYDTFMPPMAFNGRLWVRISAQVYLDMRDYEFAAETLAHLCKRVARKEYSQLQ